jgi:hypothetical protein
MDVAVNHDGKRTTATTVRQFAPSRVEKHWLAQVFELLMSVRPSADAISHGGAGTLGHDQGHSPLVVVVDNHNDPLSRRAAS